MKTLVLDVETLAIDGADQFIEPVSAPSNYTDPVKISDYIAKGTAAQREKAALDLDLARIVCLGTDRDGSVLCRTEDDERETLRSLSMQLRDDSLCVITFNGFKYDLPLVLRRCMYLGLPVPRLNLDRFRSPHIDLFSRLTLNGAVSAHSLRWYANRLGWLTELAADPLAGGSHVADAITAGRWEDVQAHCAVDVAITAKLAQWMGVLP